MGFTFSSKRIRGQIRGTVIRSEPKTNVDLVDCAFEGNLSYDIGSIFNRGIMTVDNCTFRGNYGQVSSIQTLFSC